MIHVDYYVRVSDFTQTRDEEIMPSWGQSYRHFRYWAQPIYTLFLHFFKSCNNKHDHSNYFDKLDVVCDLYNLNEIPTVKHITCTTRKELKDCVLTYYTDLDHIEFDLDIGDIIECIKSYTVLKLESNTVTLLDNENGQIVSTDIQRTIAQLTVNRSIKNIRRALQYRNANIFT